MAMDRIYTSGQNVSFNMQYMWTALKLFIYLVGRYFNVYIPKRVVYLKRLPQPPEVAIAPVRARCRDVECGVRGLEEKTYW